MSAPLRSGSCLAIVLLTLGVLPGSAALGRWSAPPVTTTAVDRSPVTTSGAAAPLEARAPTMAAQGPVAPDADVALGGIARPGDAVASSGEVALGGVVAPAAARPPTAHPHADRHEVGGAQTSPHGSRTIVGGAAPVPTALFADDVDLRHGPVPVPLALRLPSIGVDAEVLGVGITPGDVMDAPMGGAGDPVWQQAFWYRGSAIPGAASTALIAGHISGSGRPGVFADLGELERGDPIVLHDTRTGLDVRFEVDESVSYTLAEAGDPDVLRRIYGAGPVEGTDPRPSADGLSHLTLITCAGTFVGGTHDHRLVVYANRVA